MPYDSRSSQGTDPGELRLPRPPGVIRRFWARHPLLADTLIALVCLALSLGPMLNRPGQPLPVAPAVAIPLTALVACALLLRRRRWPMAAFIAAVAVSCTYLLAPAPAGGPLLLVTAYSLAVYRSSKTCWRALGVGVGVIALGGTVLTVTGSTSGQVALNALVSAVVMGLIGALIGVNVGGRKRYVEAIIDRSRQLLVERDQQAELAAAAERARIAREMHDIVSHSLTVIVTLAEGAQATADPERARAANAAISSAARDALAQMRTMLGVLRDTDGNAPLTPLVAPEVRAIVETARAAGTPITLTTTGTSALSGTAAFALARVVQEAITNAMRHAPAATMVSVTLDHRTDQTRVAVDNDGVRPSDQPPGFGLRGLAERVTHAGGTLHAGAVGADRWHLDATIPATPLDQEAP